RLEPSREVLAHERQRTRPATRHGLAKSRRAHRAPHVGIAGTQVRETRYAVRPDVRPLEHVGVAHDVARRHAPSGPLELAPNDGGPRTRVMRRARTDAERGDCLEDEREEAGLVTDVAHGAPAVTGA